MSQAQRGNSFVCGWEGCSKKFVVLKQLVEHLSEDHVGFKKEAYCCRWVDCPRANNAQASRFALISHIRSHTGEKPYTCPAPGCPREFTRSDSLNKHVKTHHPNLVVGRGEANRGSSQPVSDLGLEENPADPRGKSRSIRRNPVQNPSPYASPVVSRFKVPSHVNPKSKESSYAGRDFSKNASRQVSRIDSYASNNEVGLNSHQKGSLLKAKLNFIDDEREVYQSQLDRKRDLIRLLKAEKHILLSTLKKLQERNEHRRLKRQAKKDKRAALKKTIIDARKPKRKPAPPRRKVVLKPEISI